MLDLEKSVEWDVDLSLEHVYASEGSPRRARISVNPLSRWLTAEWSRPVSKDCLVTCSATAPLAKTAPYLPVKFGLRFELNV